MCTRFGDDLYTKVLDENFKKKGLVGEGVDQYALSSHLQTRPSRKRTHDAEDRR